MITPATFTACGLAFSVGNGSSVSRGQSGLFWLGASPPNPDDYNQISLTITNPSGALVQLAGGSGAPGDWWTQDPAASPQTWWTLALPQGWFSADALSGFTLQVSGGGGVTAADFQLSQQSDANGNFLVIALVNDIYVEEQATIVLMLGDVNPDSDQPTQTLLDIGALFWNLAANGVCESAVQPQTWTLGLPPDVATKTDNLPVTMAWTTASFGDTPSFTSDTILRPPNVAYLMPASSGDPPPIENVLAFNLVFAEQVSILPANPSGASYFLLTLVVDCSTMPWIGLGDGLLALPGDVQSATLSPCAPAPPQWQFKPPAPLKSTFVAFEIDFGDFIVDGSDAFTLQIENLLSRVPPGISSVALSWYSAPGYADGCIALPVGIVQPSPCIASASVSPTTSATDPVSVLTPVTISWQAYAASQVQISCTGASGTACLQTTSSSLNSDWSSGTYANPLTSPIDQNSSQLIFTVTACDFNGDPAGAPVELAASLTTPDYASLAFSGAVASGGASSTFSFPAFDNAISYTLQAMPSGATQSGVGGDDLVALTVPVVGGSVTVTVVGPGGGTFAALEPTWTGTAPPAAQTLLAFAWGGGVYTWVPGTAAAVNQNGPLDISYRAEFNNMATAPFVVWPTSTQWPGSISIPNSPYPQFGVTTIPTLQVNWAAGAPQLSLVSTTMADKLAPPPSGLETYSYAGPYLLSGPAPQPLPAGNPQVNTINGAPSPRYALCYYTQTTTSNAWASILSIDGITSPSLSTPVNLPQNAYPAMWNGGIALLWPSTSTNFALVIYGSSDDSNATNTLAVLNNSGCTVTPVLPGARFDVDFDPVHERIALAMAASDSGAGTMSLYAADVEALPDQASLDLPFYSVATLAGAPNTTTPVLAVGQQTGAIYTVAEALAGANGAIVMVTPDGQSMLPLFPVPVATTKQQPNVVTMAVAEPGYAQPLPKGHAKREAAR